ncbi:MAG TPA: SAF domain-containing protein [Dermatophilaceae bacterium]|nr:SAF domain-containing protein [Dermatophilaceae bacterium]
MQARRHRARRWTAGLLAGLAAFAAVSALAPAGSAAAGEPTLVARRDLPAGAVLTRADVVLADRPAELRPRTALTAYEPAVGKVAAVPISVNDVVTPERLGGSALLAGQPADHVAVTLPVARLDGLGLGPGDRVDVYAAGTGDRVATGAVVLVAPAAATEGTFGPGGAALTVALSPGAASTVAASLSVLQAGDTFVVALRRS